MSRGMRRVRAVGLVAAMGSVLGACSSLPDAANPAHWYRSVDDAVSGTPKSSATAMPPPEPAGTTATGSPADAAAGAVADGPIVTYTPPAEAPGAGQPFPRLSEVPPRPVTRTAEERQSLQTALVADQLERRYSDETIPLQGPSDGSPATTMPSAPPPPPMLSSPPGAAVPETPTPPVPSAESAPLPPLDPPMSPDVPAMPPVDAALPPDAIPAPPPVPSESYLPSPPLPTESYLPPVPDVPTEPIDAPPAYTPPEYSSPGDSSPGDSSPSSVESGVAPSTTVTPDQVGAPVRPQPASVQSAFQAALRQQEVPVAPPAEPLRPMAPAAAVPGWGGSAGAAGRTVGRGPGGERIISYSPSGPAGQAPGTAYGTAAYGGAYGTAGTGEPIATIQFASGSSALSGGDRAILREVARVWNRQGGTVQVVGHASADAASTDPGRSAAINQQVSEQRAWTVAEALAAYGVPRDRIVATGAGASLPRYLETRPTGEAGNRRVEILFVR